MLNYTFITVLFFVQYLLFSFDVLIIYLVCDDKFRLAS